MRYVIIAALILGAYAASLVPEIKDTEPYPDYYANVLPLKMTCDYDTDIRGFLKYWSNCFSYQYLGNDRVIPIAASIAVVYLTFLLANAITENRQIGIIAMAAMSVNPLLTMFDSSPTYDQVWAALFLLSIVLLYKKTVIGFMTYPVSIMTKVLAVAYIPGVIINVLIDKRLQDQVGIIFGLGILTVFGVVAISVMGTGSTVGAYPERLLDGFLRIFESIWPVFPVLVGAIVIDRFFMPKEKTTGKKVILVWMTWILLTTPLIYLFTAEQLQFGYRFVPFASFFSIYLGIVAIQLKNFITEARVKRQSLKNVLHN